MFSSLIILLKKMTLFARRMEGQFPSPPAQALPETWSPWLHLLYLLASKHLEYAQQLESRGRKEQMNAGMSSCPIHANLAPPLWGTDCSSLPGHPHTQHWKWAVLCSNRLRESAFIVSPQIIFLGLPFVFHPRHCVNWMASIVWLIHAL